MKFLISLLFFSISNMALAGVSGGGGVAPTKDPGKSLTTPQIVFHLGESQEKLKFALGVLENKGWKVQTIVVPKEAFQLDQSTLDALQESKELNEWIQVQE